MKISQEGLDLIKKYEGCYLKAYKDPVGIPTIGYGHTKNVVMGQVITQQKAEEYLLQDVHSAECKVKALDSKYHWTQAEFDALTSFCFNIGSLTGLTKFSTRSKEQIAAKMLFYVNAGGKKMAGLVKRRQEEHDLFSRAYPNLNQKYVIGNTYTVDVNGLTVRKSPSVTGEKAFKNGYRIGKKIKCEGICLDTDGNTWMKFSVKSHVYYICAIYNGRLYIV